MRCKREMGTGITYPHSLLLSKQRDYSLVGVTRSQGAPPRVLLQCSSYLTDTKVHAGT